MTAIIFILLLPAGLVGLVFLLEVLAGLRPLRDGAPAAPADRIRATVLVPAHDEEAVIVRGLATLKQAAAGVADILVVADNCIDRTAELARGEGVRVTERHDLERRGKGFALAHARATLSDDPPDVVVVLDADCAIDRQSLSALVADAHAGGRPAQAINLLQPAPGAAPGVRVSTFAFMLKNLIRQRGLQRLGGRVHLTGTGMALPWPLFERARLATADIVEDVKLGLELDRAGYPPQLVSGATVWSPPADAAGTLVQRSRWEGGYLANMREAAPPAVMTALRRASPRELFAALDLCIPPLALFALLNTALLAVAAALTWLTGASWWPVLAFATILLASFAAILAAWAVAGRAFLGGRDLLRLPLYVLWKVPMYLGLRRKGTPTEWLRTGR